MTQFLHGLFPYPLPCGIFAISEAEKGKNAEFPPGTGWFQSCRSRGNAPSAFFHVLEVFIPCLKPGSLALNHLQLWGFVFSRIHPLCLKAEMMQCEPSAEKWTGLREVMLRQNSFLLKKTNKPGLKATRRVLKSKAGFESILRQTPRKRSS